MSHVRPIALAPRQDSPSSSRLSVRELISLSEFGRAFPERVSELLDRCADPLFEDRSDTKRR